MATHNLNGQCHCGNVQVEIELPRAPATYNPRACDCDFCRKHGASYVSDPNGSFRIQIKDNDLLSLYRQGSGIAECLLCRKCGVLLAVVYRHEGRVYATANIMAIDGGPHFGEEKSVSPKLLSAEDKVGRWKENWFANVTVNVARA